jgi:lipoprotein-anchoring transpeptidase ErfK/SrfK
MTSVLLTSLLLQVIPAPQGTVKPQQLTALAVQVALDRAGYSPGALDGSLGGNTRKALDAYRKANGGAEPQPTEPLMRYRVTDQDASGPFEPAIPSDLVEQAQLKTLGYRNVHEMLAERFHSTPAFLQRLNPQAKFVAGEEIMVPNVDPMLIPATPPKADPPKGAAETKAANADKKAEAAAAQAAHEAKPDVKVTVSKSASALTVTDAGGKVVMYAPVTTGSQQDPLPLGSWKVNGVSLIPPFRYNPELFWDADPTHTKTVVPPGPNNPVGLVWIDISKEHYGLHGTPEPATIGRTESHGCVRLTNWDALRLASLVKPGTPVVFVP